MSFFSPALMIVCPRDDPHGIFNWMIRHQDQVATAARPGELPAERLIAVLGFNSVLVMSALVYLLSGAIARWVLLPNER